MAKKTKTRQKEGTTLDVKTITAHSIRLKAKTEEIQTNKLKKLERKREAERRTTTERSENQTTKQKLKQAQNKHRPKDLKMHKK
mgnify:CR=1 FL=1